MNRSTKLRWVLTLVCTSLALFLMTTPNAQAQSQLNRIDVYGAYSFLHPKLPGKLDPSDPSAVKAAQTVLGNLSGWNAGATVNVTNSFGITSDISGYYKNFNTTIDGSTLDANVRAYTFLFGPQFMKKGEQLRPFVRALFGAVHASGKASFDGDSGEASRNVFAASLGGGLDVRIHENIAIRAAQLDYFPFRSSEGGGLTFNNYRFGAGVVFYLR